MKKIVLTAVLSIVIGLTGGWLIFRPESSGSASGAQMASMNGAAGGGTADRKIAYYKDPMHPWYTSEKPGIAPDCGMDLVPVYEGESTGEGIKIDPLVVQNIGVKVEEVVKRTLTRSIRTVGKVDYDERRVYSVNSKIMGWVETLHVDYMGQLVRKGEPLMELYSPELVSAQEEYLQAIDYQKKLQASSLEEARKGADELVQSVRRRLLNWDIPESEIKALEQRGTPNKTMTIYSPADGIVTEKMVQKGQNIMGGMELYKIADLSTVWVIADVYQYELPWVQLGGKAGIALSYLPGRTFDGTVTYIYPYLNMETKTVKVRVEVRNTKDFELKPDMYATVTISSPVSVHAVAVPEDAIIRSGARNVAVMALGGGYFDPRDVTLGLSADGYVQILDGIREGEKIVTSSQFLIDSESNLKAAISQMAGGQTKTAEGTPAKGKNGGMEKTMRAEDTTGSASAAKVTDPVCGMHIDPDEDLAYAFKGKKYFFCSEDDLEKFKSDPEKYLAVRR